MSVGRNGKEDGDMVPAANDCAVWQKAAADATLNGLAPESG
jgi:hypothetical protein